MKRVFGVIALTAMALLAGGVYQVRQPAAYAQKTGGKGTLTATGVGVVKAPADTAKVTFAVQVTSKDMKSAQEEISTQTQKLMAGVKVLKLAGMDVKLAPLAVAEMPALLDDKKGKTSYQLTQSFQVTLTSDDPEKLLDHANTVVGASIANGANAAAPNSPPGFGGGGGFGPGGGGFGPGGGFGGGGAGPRVAFSLRDESSKRREALEVAVADAVKNAKALAKGAGVTLGEMIAVNDPPATATGQHAFDAFQNAANFTDDYGEREITVRVTVVFGY